MWSWALQFGGAVQIYKKSGCGAVAFVLLSKNCNKKTAPKRTVLIGALEGTRTPDPLLRRQLLYPPELQTHIPLLHLQRDKLYHHRICLSRVLFTEIVKIVITKHVIKSE